MACIACGVDKLAKEFPPYNGSKDCDHPSLTCLRCLVQYVDNNESCSHPDCDIKISKQATSIQLFKAILSKQFKVYEAAYTPPVDVSGGSQYINVTGLTGDSVSIPYTPNTTIDQVKLQIQQKLKHETGKQKLLYEGKEMNVNRANGGLATLSDYGVKPNTTICLVICLFSIPDYFDNVVFDLYWGYPHRGADFLDASCLIFKGSNYDNVVDYRQRHGSYGNAIRHSGDVMDNKRRIGHHTINLSLKNIPSGVTHLFFTLSAWNSPNIAHYPNPSLKFYDAKTPGKDLCKTTFTHARNSQAVVMCSLSRHTSGNWTIFESGKLSSGNAMNYNPLITTVRQLIASGI